MRVSHQNIKICLDIYKITKHNLLAILIMFLRNTCMAENGFLAGKFCQFYSSTLNATWQTPWHQSSFHSTDVSTY